MFCPKCATQNVDGASYCRSCGANISLVPQALTGQLPVADQPQWTDRYERHKRRRHEPSVEEAIRSLMMGVAFAVILGLVSLYGSGSSTWRFWLLIPTMMLFARGFSHLLRLGIARRQNPTLTGPQFNSVRPQDLPAAKTGELMTPVPSVTEGTTRHLGVEATTRKFDSFENQKPS